VDQPEGAERCVHREALRLDEEGGECGGGHRTDPEAPGEAVTGAALAVGDHTGADDEREHRGEHVEGDRGFEEAGLQRSHDGVR